MKNVKWVKQTPVAEWKPVNPDPDVDDFEGRWNFHGVDVG